MAGVTSPALVGGLAKASRLVCAVTGFLEQIANLLRQLVHITGWLILLASCINLLIHPHLSLEHLLMPGFGTLAVLQSMIRPRRRPEDTDAVILLESTPPIDAEPWPGEVVIDGVVVEAEPDRTEDL